MSILVISLVAWLFGRITHLKICPICAGTSLSWFWMLAGMLTNQLPVISYQLPVAILMGGSVVGIAYQLEKHLPSNRSPLLWKVIFVPLGFAAVYAITNFLWGAFFPLAVLAVTTALMFLYYPLRAGTENKKVGQIEKEMENCC